MSIGLEIFLWIFKSTILYESELCDITPPCVTEITLESCDVWKPRSEGRGPTVRAGGSLQPVRAGGSLPHPWHEETSQ